MSGLRVTICPTIVAGAALLRFMLAVLFCVRAAGEAAGGGGERGGERMNREKGEILCTMRKILN